METQADKTLEGSAQQWRGALPKAVAQQTVPFQAPGFDEADAAQASQGLETITQRTQPLTRDAVLKYTMQGMANPKTRDEALLSGKVLEGEVARGEEQTFRDAQAREAAAERASNLKLTLAQRAEDLKTQLAQRAEDLKARLEDRTLDRNSRAELQKLHDQTLLQMNTATNAARIEAAGMVRAGQTSAQAREDAKDAREARRSVESLSRRAEPIVPMLSAARQVQDIVDTANETGTNVPGIGFVKGSLPISMMTPEGTQARQKIQMFANAMVRAQAGLSQTLSEQERADLELLASGRFREDQFRKVWPNLMQKVNSTVDAIQSGYEPDVLDTFNKRGAQFKSIAPRTGKKVAGTVKPSGKFSIVEE
jgi:hypothetical protein